MNFRQRFTYLKGNILVFSITDLLGNFSRRLVFPYVSLYILPSQWDGRLLGWTDYVSARRLSLRP